MRSSLRKHTAAVCLSQHSHTFVCHLFGFGSSYTAHTHCCCCSAPACTLTTASCVLPWTLISTHLALPVWQETASQLTRQRRTPAAPESVETLHLFWQQSVLFVPSLLCVSMLVLLAKLSWFPPHFITLLPLWAAVPTALRDVGGLWNFRCRPGFWSGGREFPPQPHPAIPSPSNLRSVSVRTQSGLYSRPSQAPPGTRPQLS